MRKRKCLVYTCPQQIMANQTDGRTVIVHGWPVQVSEEVARTYCGTHAVAAMEQGAE